MAAMAAMLAGCSTVLGIDDLRPPTIHGTLRDVADLVSNASIALYRDPDGAGQNSTPIAHATTGGDGKFAFPIAKDLPLHGYLELVDPRFVHTFSHLVQPLVDGADLDIEVLTLTAAALQMIAGDAHMTQDPTRSVVIAQVVDADGGTLAGATIHAQAAGDPPMDILQICAVDPSTSLPCATGTTRSDGMAWLFDVPQTMELTITAVDGDGKSHEVAFPVVAGPSLVFTPVPPAP
jgi:hypothetical protein